MDKGDNLSKKNFGLTQENFLELVKKLKEGDNTLFEHVFLSHFTKSRLYIVKSLQIDKDEAHDVTMDALLAFRRGLIENKITYGNLNYLFTLMAKQQWLRKMKKENKKDEDSLKKQLYSDVSVMYNENSSFKKALDRAWNEQKEGCRSLLQLVFYRNLALNEIAEMEQIAYDTVKKRRQRCIQYLRSLVIKYYHE